MSCDNSKKIFIFHLCFVFVKTNKNVSFTHYCVAQPIKLTLLALSATVKGCSRKQEQLFIYLTENQELVFLADLHVNISTSEI